MRICYLVVFCILALGCGEEVIKKPPNLIAREKMSDILYDLAMINAAKAINPHVLEENGVDPMKFIYRKYEIDSAQFVQSDIYYASLPIEYERLYKEVETRLEMEKTRLEEVRKQRNDSTRLEMENNVRTDTTGGLRKINQDTIP